MTIQTLVTSANLFFLLFARFYAFFSVTPLLGSQALPGMARAGLTLLTTATLFPWAQRAGLWFIPDNGWAYLSLIFGEVLLGLFQGLVIVLVFSVFQMSGQLLATPMGFGVSEVFDPMAQIELPLIGQLFNLVATLLFLSISGLQKVFFTGIWQSVQAIRASDFLTFQGNNPYALVGAFAELFTKSLLLSFPILGILVLVNITMGLLGKAAPQMNLMMIGFPITILTGFVVMIFVFPYLANAFGVLFDQGLEMVLRVSGVQPGTVVR